MNRREFLQALGLGAAAVQVSALQQVLAAAPAGAFRPASVDERDPAAHAITRLTFGVTPALYAHVQQIGTEAFIEEQLTPENISDAALDSRMQPFNDILSQNGGVLAQTYRDMRQTVAGALLGGTLLRATYSERQLYERMVHFFSDHFSLYIGKAQVMFLKVDDDRDAMRPYAMGHFRELLGASAHSPAMLVFLDNARSEKSAPNENYARELMELHTLGLNGGYTETDVKEVARALTGWSIQGGRQSQDSSTTYRFRPAFHDKNAKTVLGNVIAAGGGEADGEKVLDILASHPSTARFVSSKLVRRFVADAPPDSLVTACAETFKQSGGDLRAVLRVIFNSDAFWNAPPRFKQPLEYTISLFRALNVDIQDTTPFLRGIRSPLVAMGQIPFNWPAPNGYPDVGAYWMNNLLPRWNMAIAVASDAVRGAQAGTDALADLLAANNVPLETEPVLDFMGMYLFGRPLSGRERPIVLDFARTAGTDEGTQIAAGLALLLASPAYQYK